MCLAIAIGIPILPGKATIPLLLMVCVFQTIYSSKAKFQTNAYRIIRMIYLISNTMIHFLLTILILPVEFSDETAIGLGYAAIFFMLLDILIDCLGIILGLAVIIYALIKTSKINNN